MTDIEDYEFQRYVIDRTVPFPVIIKQAGFGQYSYDGKCFCIFHNNVDTPAAKLYKDKEGDTLWCFSEQKRYRPSDVLVRKMIPGKTVAYIFKNIWSQLSEDNKNFLLEQYGKPVSEVSESWKENSHILEDFKYGKIGIAEWLVRAKVILS